MTTTITAGIHYVGVNDRNKQLFEGLWPLPDGVSYNSYLISDDKTVLIDTVEVDFFMQFLENIREAIGDRPIDYLVVNHMEPDHSGMIRSVLAKYPGMKIIGNDKTFELMDSDLAAYAKKHEASTEQRAEGKGIVFVDEVYTKAYDL